MNGKESLEAINIDPAKVLQFCALHGASDVAVFGSVARGESHSESD